MYLVTRECRDSCKPDALTDGLWSVATDSSWCCIQAKLETLSWCSRALVRMLHITMSRNTSRAAESKQRHKMHLDSVAHRSPATCKQ